MAKVNDRASKFQDCLTFYDGINFYQFFEECKGTLTLKPAGNVFKEDQSNLWLIFILKNYNKTLIEMTDDERIKNTEKINALNNFIE